jgi:pimeloyl-ACP methyl ester carboxylesterase
MPYVTSDGVRTRYEVEGSGPPLVLHIGFLGSLEDWSREDAAYTQALRDTFQLILVDPRGQGQSDKPHDPQSYALDARAGDILAVLDELGIDRSHFWGYSMGGSVGYMLAARHQNRLRSLIVGASHPWWEPPGPEKDQLYRWLANGMEAFVAEWERVLGPLPPGRAIAGFPGMPKRFGPPGACRAKPACWSMHFLTRRFPRSSTPALTTIRPRSNEPLNSCLTRRSCCWMG